MATERPARAQDNEANAFTRHSNLDMNYSSLPSFGSLPSGSTQEQQGCRGAIRVKLAQIR
jgi:hypothetical protein